MNSRTVERGRRIIASSLMRWICIAFLAFALVALQGFQDGAWIIVGLASVSMVSALVAGWYTILEMNLAGGGSSVLDGSADRT